MGRGRLLSFCGFLALLSCRKFFWFGVLFIWQVEDEMRLEKFQRKNLSASATLAGGPYVAA